MLHAARENYLNSPTADHQHGVSMRLSVQASTQWHALRTTRAHTAPLSACAFNGVRRDSDTRTTEQARLGQVDCPAEVLGKI